VIYESFSPDNSHQMREYMLHVVTKNIKRMRKHKLISDEVSRMFKL